VRKQYAVMVPGMPTFFLDVEILGIVSEDHARRLAEKIVGEIPMTVGLMVE